MYYYNSIKTNIFIPIQKLFHHSSAVFNIIYLKSFEFNVGKQV